MKIMTLIHLTALSLCLMLCAATPSTQPGAATRSSDNAVISVKALDEGIDEAGPVCVKITLKNVGTDILSVPFNGLLGTYSFDVRGPNGEVEPLTAWGRQEVSAAQDASCFGGGISPGKSQSVVIFLNAYYDMSWPGKYVIRAKKQFLDGSEVESDPLIVEVRRRHESTPTDD